MFQAAHEHLGGPLGTPPGELQGTEVTLVWPPLSSGPRATGALTALKATDQWSRLSQVRNMRGWEESNTTMQEQNMILTWRNEPQS